MTEEHAIDVLMQDKGDVISANAWEGYLAVGKGLVFIEGSENAYWPQGWVERLPLAVRRRVLLLVAHYRPETEVVVVLMCLDESARSLGLALGKRRPRMAPEDAFLHHTGRPEYPSVSRRFLPEETDREAYDD